MGMDENYSRELDKNMALIETPLIAPSNSYYRQEYKTAIYPYNISSAHSTLTEVVTYDSSSSSNDKELIGNGNIGQSGGGVYTNNYGKQSRYQLPQVRVCVITD